MKRAKYSAMRERSVGLGRDGVPFVPAIENDPDGRVMAKVWNRRDVPAYQAAGGRCVRQTGRMSAARAPMPPITGSWSVSPTRWRLRRPRPFPSSAAATSPASSRTRRMRIRTRHCPGLSPSRTRILKNCWRKKAEHRRCLVVDLHQRRFGAASRLPDAGRKRRLQDRVRNRPALADRARGATARRSSARRNRSTSSCPRTLHKIGPAPHPLGSVEEGREVALLLPLQIHPARRVRRVMEAFASRSALACQ
jgi:hypothetical protein